MSLKFLPPTSSTNLQEWGLWDEIDRLLDRRFRVAFSATGSPAIARFPAETKVWALGKIAGATSDGTHITITFATLEWNGDTGNVPADPADFHFIDGDGVHRWTSFSGTFNGAEVAGAPGTYEAVVDWASDDSSAVLVATITETLDDGVKVPDDGSWTLNRSLASLAGKWIRIQRSGGRCWAQRRLQRPNDYEWGFVHSGKAVRITPSADYSITVGTETTALVPQAATAAALEAAIAGLASVGLGKVKADGNADDGFVVVFDSTVDLSTFTASGATIAAALDVVGDVNQAWDLGEHDDRELMIFANGQWGRRAVASTKSFYLVLEDEISPELSIATDGWLVDAGGFWRPEMRSTPTLQQGRNGQYWTRDFKSRPFEWYLGRMKTHWSHKPDDTVDRVQVVAMQTMDLNLGNDLAFCEIETTDVFMKDVYIDYLDVCSGTPDTFLANDFWKTPVARQVAIEALVGSFVEKKSYTGEKYINQLSMATLLASLGINSQETTITGVSGGGVASCSIAMPGPLDDLGGGWAAPSELDCWWALKNSDGQIEASGGFDNSVASAISLSPGNPLQAFGVGDVGKTLVISFGFTTHWWPRVPRLHPRSGFRPDLDESGLAVQDPPTNDSPGIWETENASTTYWRFDPFGELQDTGQAFIEKVAAQFCGNSVLDPTGEEDSGNADIYAPYEDALVDVTPLDPDAWPQHELSGVATDGGVNFLTDTNRTLNYSKTPKIVHSGTATLGTDEMHLVDSTKAGDGFWGRPFGNGLLGQVVRKKVGSDVVGKSPVASQLGTTLTLAYPLTGLASGTDYEIAEPGGKAGASGPAVMNYFAGATLVGTDAGSTQSLTFTLSHDDAETVWFPNAGTHTISAGFSYNIIRDQPGGVYLFKGGKHVSTAGLGADASLRRVTPRAWRDDARLNSPTICKGVGRLRKMDLVDLTYFQELYAMLGELGWTRAGAGWDSLGNPNHSSGLYTGAAGGTECDEAKAFAETDWTGRGPNDDGTLYPPDSYAQLVSAETADIAAAIEGRGCFPTADVLNVMARSVTFLGYGTIDASDPDEFTGMEAGYDVIRTFASGPLLFRKWSELGTVGPNTTLHVIGDAPLNSIPPAIPSYPVCPPHTDGTNQYKRQKGWYADNQLAIVKWDVAGGVDDIYEEG